MKRKIMVNGFGCLLLIAMTLPFAAVAEEPRQPENALRSLERSAFTPDERDGLRAKAVSAIQKGVPAGDVDLVLSRSIDRKADAAAISRYLDACVSALEGGFPLEPLVDRIALGLAKGVSPGQIAAATERLASQLAEARPLVDLVIQEGLQPGRSVERREAIEASARALDKAVVAGDIKGMGAVVRERRGGLPLFTSAVDTTAYLAGRGMEAATAVRIVRNAVDGGYSIGDLDSMVKRMDAHMKRGLPAMDAARMMERESMHGTPGMQGPGMQPMMDGQGGSSGMDRHMRR